jgi:glycosyltransferase involved in cell wall biosynthesis
MLKVIHIQFATHSAGGVVPKLHQAFLESDIDSEILTLNKNRNDGEHIIHLGRIPKVLSLLDTLLSGFISKNNRKEFGLFSYSFFGTNVSKINQVKDADIIYLHWVHFGFLNLQSIEQLARLKKPIIIFMHDMWAITGGCHVSFSCEKYKSHCNDCQMFSGDKKNDWSSRQFDKKLKLYSKYSNLYFVAPSKWLHDCIKQSLLTKNKPSFCIPNIVDNKVYKPFNKIIARQILDLNVDDTILAFGAVTVNNPAKGWVYFKKALDILKSEYKDSKITVLFFGDGFNKQIANEIPFKTKSLGYLSDEYSTALVYNAADIFVASTLADNLPTTVLQSLSCGTPVVGFDVGGVPDMIKHKSNGYLAKYKDETDLATGIQYCLMNKLEVMLPLEFDKNIIIEQHINLIKSIKS